jgi:hypothetical protein
MNYRPVLRLLALAPIVGMLVWGSQAFASGGLDPARADELAHRALPGPNDLPGGGWQITKQDDFSHDPPPDTKACNNSAQQIDRLADQVDVGLAGRAEIELTKDDLSIETTVEVYNDAKPLADGFSQIAVIFKGDNLVQCFVDSLKSAMGAGDDLSVKATEPLATLPSGAAGRGFDIVLPSQNLALHTEQYHWLYGNTAVTLQLTGLPSDVTKEAAQFMVDGLQGALDYVSSH